MPGQKTAAGRSKAVAVPQKESWLEKHYRAKFLVDFFLDLAVLLLMAVGSRGAHLAIDGVNRLFSGTHASSLSYIEVDIIRYTATAFDLVTLLAVPVLAISNLARFVTDVRRGR